MSFNYQSIIERTFEERCVKNPKYSLRSLARDLKLAPSHLSGILSGKLGLSRSSANRIANQLGLSPAEQEAFIASVENRHARSQSARALAFERLQKLNSKVSSNAAKLATDHFHFVADWYHMAILEILRLRNCKTHSIWIGHRLGIPVNVVKPAVQRLQSLGLLKIKNGQWTTTNQQTLASSETPSLAIRKFHQQILQKALTAINSQKLDERDFRSSIMAIRKSKIPAAKDMIQKFFEEFGEEIGGEFTNGHSDQDEIYVLSTQFFRLSEKEDTQ